MVRVVAQRVQQASVSVGGDTIASIGAGLALLVGISTEDSTDDVARIARKVAEMRIFEDQGGKMNLAASDVSGEILVVSQFTLYADLRRGRRPSFTQAAPPDVANRLCDLFADCLVERGYRVQRGRFGAHMIVELANDGPVTIILDSAGLS